MTESAERPSVEVPGAAACAEAAAWIARLHADDRTIQVEAGFKRWLAASPEHRAAFELANDLWASTEVLPKPKTPTFVRFPKAGVVVTWPRALAALALIATLAVGIGLYSRDQAGVGTGVGEQRNMTLEDGTRVSLNTASRIHVHYDRAARRVELDGGEALFEVAKHPEWPFIVIAGGQQVVARGTTFLVRRDEDRLAVTLVEGKVIVAPSNEAVNLANSNSEAVTRATGRSDITLIPGQRLTFTHQEQPKLDLPSLERVTAWQHGQIILDHTPLREAVAEMNRYSDRVLTIEEPEVGRAQVTGIFRVGDSSYFAQAVAETYHLRVADRAGRIVLSGLPDRNGGESNER